MTLLEKAVATKVKNKTIDSYSESELVELAVAVLAGDVTTAQASKVLYPNKNPTHGYQNGTNSHLFSALKRGILGGRITIVKPKEKK